MLDFGCADTIYGIISLAQYIPEIVLAEYVERNRAKLHKWLQGEKPEPAMYKHGEHWFHNLCISVESVCGFLDICLPCPSLLHLMLSLQELYMVMVMNHVPLIFTLQLNEV